MNLLNLSRADECRNDVYAERLACCISSYPPPVYIADYANCINEANRSQLLMPKQYRHYGRASKFIHIFKFLILFFLFTIFVACVSAQDNYTVIVKCYPIDTKSSGYMVYTGVASSIATTIAPPYGASSNGTTSSAGALVYKVSNSGNINAKYNSSLITTSYTTSGGGQYQARGSSSISEINYTGSCGFVKFNVSNSSYVGTISSQIILNLWRSDTNDKNSVKVYQPTLSNGWIEITKKNLINVWQNSSTFIPITIPTGGGVILNSSMTSSMLAFVQYGGTSSNSISFYGANCATTSRRPYLAFLYSAPWSAVISPSATTGAASECAVCGKYTLSASQDYNSSYVTISPTSWKWYSATDGSNGNYSLMGGTTASTYAVTAPTNTGSVWYKFRQTVNFYSNSTLETKANTYSINHCSPACVYVSNCSSIGSPSFASYSPGDRKVTFELGIVDNADHYVIRYGTVGGLGYREKVVSAGDEGNVVIDNLTNGHTYYFHVQAIGAEGYCNTLFSDSVRIMPKCEE